MDLQWLGGTWDRLWAWLLHSGWRIGTIVVLLLVARSIGRALVARALSWAMRSDSGDVLRDIGVAKRRATLVGLFNGILNVVVILIALMMIFRELDFEIGPLLASAGVVGVAIGFGAQSLVRDVLSGVFIILENQFGVGDVIRVGADSGLVEQINLRTTVLRGADGAVTIVPNGEISRVSVLTKDWSRLVLDMTVGYGADLNHVYSVVKRVLDRYAADHPQVVIEPPEVLGVEQLGDNGVVVRALVKTAPRMQWETGRKLRKLIKEAFDAEGIEIPFPQRVVWMRANGESEAQRA
jgi:small conductance mechanosensitive channel